MIIGQAAFGSLYAFIMVPSLLEMLEVALEYFPDREREVNNMCTGMYGALLGLS